MRIMGKFLGITGRENRKKRLNNWNSHFKLIGAQWKGWGSSTLVEKGGALAQIAKMHMYAVCTIKSEYKQVGIGVPI